MKNIFKKLTFAIAVMLTVTLCVPAFSSLSVFAGTNAFAPKVNYITINGYNSTTNTGYKSTANVGDTYTIPTAMIGTTEVTDITVKGPNNQTVTITGNTFLIEKIGTYTITYTSNGVSTDLKVSAFANVGKYSVTFEKNSENIVPSVINPEKVENAFRTIVFPDAIVLDKDGEVIENATITTNMYKDNTEATNAGWNSSTKTLTIDTLDDVKYTVVYSYKIDNKEIAHNSISITTDTDYENTYSYTYSYSGAPKPTTAEIGVEKVLPGITATNTTTNATIPVYYTITATNGDKTYTATTDGTTNSEKTKNTALTINEDGAYVLKATVVGDYIITYTVNDFFDNNCEVSSHSYTLSDVKDTSAPSTPIATLPYNALGDLGTLTAEQAINAEEALPSNHSDNDFYLLPIYANDNSNGIVGNNLTMYRTLKKGSMTVFNEKNLTQNVTNKVLVFNASSALTGKYNAYVSDSTNDQVVFSIYLKGETIEILASQIYIVEEDNSALTQTISNGNTYTATYFAKDATSGKSTTSVTFTMDVVDSTFTATDPVVKLPTNLPNKVLPGTTISFAEIAPTDEFDKRLSNYFTYSINSVDYLDINSENSLLSYDADTKKYSIEIPEDANFTSLTLKVKSQTDDGTFAEATKEIIVLTTGDTTATTITSHNINSENVYEQGNLIYLPEVVYEDDLPQFLNVQIKILDPNGNEVAVQNANNGVISGTQYTTKLACFTPSMATSENKYIVTYTSIDAGNNVTILVFELAIDENPTLWEYDIELPSTINNNTAIRCDRNDLQNTNAVELPTPTLVSSTDKLTMGTYTINIKSENAFDRQGNDFFMPRESGLYTITYEVNVLATATFDDFDEDGIFKTYYNGDVYRVIESQPYTITVTDTTAPEFTNMETGENNIKSFFEAFNYNGSRDKDAGNIDLIAPTTIADDIDWAKSNVTISYLNTTNTLKLDNFDNLKNQVFDQDATYSITYTLVDFDGNKTEKTFTLDVGDVKAPVITVDTGVVDKTSYKINESIVIDMSKIQATDNITGEGENLITKDSNGKFVLNSDCEIEIYLKNTSTSAKITNELSSNFSTTDMNVSFQVATAGEYKLVIEITDGQDKTATYDSTLITITEDENTGATAEEILGIVLIVVSVLLLGGVITYFVVSRKAFEKKYK